MPLSEYEQRVLAQMEQHLRDADPALEKSLASKGRLDVRKISIGVVVAIAGLGLLVAGVATGAVWLGILGFMVMLGGVMMATSLTPHRGAGGRASRSRSSFMARQQERWERRQEGGR